MNRESAKATSLGSPFHVLWAAATTEAQLPSGRIVGLRTTSDVREHAHVSQHAKYCLHMCICHTQMRMISGVFRRPLRLLKSSEQLLTENNS